MAETDETKRLREENALLQETVETQARLIARYQSVVDALRAEVAYVARLPAALAGPGADRGEVAGTQPCYQCSGILVPTCTECGDSLWDGPATAWLDAHPESKAYPRGADRGEVQRGRVVLKQPAPVGPEDWAPPYEEPPATPRAERCPERSDRGQCAREAGHEGSHVRDFGTDVWDTPRAGAEGERATCENRGHLWGPGAKCVFCETPKRAEWLTEAAPGPKGETKP